jgi:adenine C2-methylase RlmN of 23S rRNA A2503 and tRNA A37
LGISQRSVTVSTVGLVPAIRKLNVAGVACTVRDTRGQEIAAACGQLAAEG